jgi:hypothetical protein
MSRDMAAQRGVRGTNGRSLEYRQPFPLRRRGQFFVLEMLKLRESSC